MCLVGVPGLVVVVFGRCLSRRSLEVRDNAVAQ
jgi:hypothetical protein